MQDMFEIITLNNFMHYNDYYQFYFQFYYFYKLKFLQTLFFMFVGFLTDETAAT